MTKRWLKAVALAAAAAGALGPSPAAANDQKTARPASTPPATAGPGRAPEQLWPVKITSKIDLPGAGTGRSGYVRSPEQLSPAAVVSTRGVVVSGSDQASQAGAAILEAGGNAVDAAVATAFALGVTEPMTSGLGAETLILIRMADGRVRAIDGSSYVPGAVDQAELHRLRDAAPRGYLQDYKSAATPGSLAALAYALQRHGTRSLAEVMAPAIELADFGFRLSVTGAAEVDGLAYLLRPHERLADLLLKDFTETWGPDHAFCGGELAATLKRIAAAGPDEFYRGSIADEIDADMVAHGGYLRKADLVALRAVECRPIRDTYRGLEVITFPSPGGGASLVELLHILEAFPEKLLREESVDRLHLLIEASRIAWVDVQDSKRPPFLRDLHLVDRGWAAQRARLIRFDRTLRPEEISGETVEPYLTLGTTQVSVVDRWGNVVGLAQTLGGFFGAGVITPGLGFLYNSNLNAFSFTNPADPHFAAPGRAVMTALTPTILLKDGKPILVLGSAGSDRVVPTLASVVTAVADRNLGPREAVAAPRAMWGTNWADPRAFVELAGEITPENVDALEQRGFADIYRQMFPARWIDISVFGGTNAVFVDPATGTATGVPDPRRSGAAAAPQGP